MVVSRRLGMTKCPFRPTPSAAELYVETLQEELFEPVEGLAEESYYATHSMDASKGPGGIGGGGGARGRGGAEGASRNAGSRLTKVGSEISRLATDKDTIHWSSAILVRVDEARMDYLRALLTGPADTPYANGCFLFDIGLPPEFPENNPAVQFLTTGGGTVRFNPNL